jgi:hypothetical protein
MHFLDDIVVPVLAHVRKACCEDNIASLLTGQKHFLEEQIIHMIIVDETCASDEVKVVFVFLWAILRVTELMLVQLCIAALDRSFLKHIWTNVASINIFESLVGQIFTDQACATRHIENFHFGGVPLVFLTEFGCICRYEFRIRVAHSEVHSLVV